MTTTSSTDCATSASRWLDTSTARPCAGLVAQQPAHPADPGRVEPVGGLVEDQHLRVAEQRGGDRQPLAHAHRVALHAPVGGARRGRRSSTSSTRSRGCRPPAASTRRWLRAVRPGWKAAPRARRRPARSDGRAPRSGGRRTSRCPPVGWTSPSSARSVVLLPAPFGPRKPVTRPASTSKLRSRTAWTLPNRLYRSRISTGAIAAHHGASACAGSAPHPMLASTPSASSRSSGVGKRGVTRTSPSPVARGRRAAASIAAHVCCAPTSSNTRAPLRLSQALCPPSDDPAVDPHPSCTQLPLRSNSVGARCGPRYQSRRCQPIVVGSRAGGRATHGSRHTYRHVVAGAGPSPARPSSTATSIAPDRPGSAMGSGVGEQSSPSTASRRRSSPGPNATQPSAATSSARSVGGGDDRGGRSAATSRSVPGGTACSSTIPCRPAPHDSVARSRAGTAHAWRRPDVASPRLARGRNTSLASSCPGPPFASQAPSPRPARSISASVARFDARRSQRPAVNAEAPLFLEHERTRRRRFGRHHRIECSPAFSTGHELGPARRTSFVAYPGHAGRVPVLVDRDLEIGDQRARE